MSALKSKPVVTESSGTQALPEWLTSMAKSTAEKGQEISTKPYEAYGGENPFALSNDSQSAFQALRDYVSGGNGGVADAAKAYSSAPAQKVSAEGTFDGDGIGKYMSTYADAALTPALQKISAAADAARLRSKAGATSAGAFGDARHGIVESNIDKNETTAIGDTTGQFMNQAFQQAVAARQGDIGRKLTADTTNASLAETALGRLLSGATAGNGATLGGLMSLMNAGQYQDQLGASAANWNQSQFNEARDYDKSATSWLMSMLQGTPSDRTTTQTSTQTGGPSPWMNVIAGLAGGVGAGFGNGVGASVGAKI